MKSLQLHPYQHGVSGTVRVPGSKSLTNRALLLASLAKGTSHLKGGLESDDSEVMQNALKELGIDIQKENEVWHVNGNGGSFLSGKHEIYLGNAGTAVRFLTAAGCLIDGNIRIYGKPRMHERPIADLLKALQQIGADITTEENNGCPPVLISGNGKIPGGECKISGGTSSQFLSALLHIAPLTEKGIRLHITPPLVSRPYLEMTINLLKTFGIETEEISEYEYQVLPQKIQPVDIEIEADASSAAHVFSLPIAAQGEVTITNFPKKSLQGDIKFLEVAQKLGAKIEYREKGTRLKMDGEVQPLGEIDLEDIPDAAMAVVTLSALAKGNSKITGLGTLRKKECDRIEALVSNLKKMGANVECGEDWIEVFGDPDFLHGAEIETYDDHRVAMSFAALGGKIPGVVILDPDCTKKTFPNFWEVFETIRFTP
jgi:3-phosphoshikimate 1-carboxyvinyltransferase